MDNTTEFKSGFAAICGRANAGKSTLLNALLGEKVAITSPKPQTTRNVIKGIYSSSAFQIVFTDVPGIHRPRTRLGEIMAKSISDSARDADCVLFLFEADSSRLLESEEKLLKRISENNIPIILVITKIDRFPKEKILSAIDICTKSFDFDCVVPVSSVCNDGLDILIDEIEKLLPTGPRYYPDDMHTDQTQRQLASEIIREKALFSLSEEVPHGLAVEIISFTEKESVISIQANIYCEKSSHKGIIIGKKGLSLKSIASRARADMEKLFGKKVYLECWVKVREDWRNRNFDLNDLGFLEK